MIVWTARQIMKNREKPLYFKAVLLLLAFLLPAEGRPAQPWPQRSVRLMVPFGPASGADVTARLLADHLSRRWARLRTAALDLLAGPTPPGLSTEFQRVRSATFVLPANVAFAAARSEDLKVRPGVAHTAV
jgi:hypothetical protein